MLKKILIVFGVIAAMILILGGIGVWYFLPDKNHIADFIVEHPDKSAIQLVRNDSVLIDFQSDKMMPLASTVKIIIAIEYAEQAAKGMIDADELIDLDDLEKFHIPNTDGGAHNIWLKSIENIKQENRIPLRKVAQGMIQFSSNANTEWLCDKLGLANINRRIDSLGIQSHSPIYYIVSALFVGKERFPELAGGELAQALRALSVTDYMEITDRIHQKLLNDPQYKNEVGDLGLGIQKVWSDRLPASTAGEYSGIIKKLNDKTPFSPLVYTYLDEVMETIMNNPANQKWLEHAGTKGGSTAFVLTKAIYATDKEGATTELVYFFHELDQFENLKLQGSINEFELNVLQSDEFRKTLVDRLRSL